MAKKQSFFAGGIHPADGSDKALTSGKSIIQYVPKKVSISMKQGLGPACACVVKVGDHVEQGQLIGQAGHFLSADILASVTGTVESADEQNCVIITEGCKLTNLDADYYKSWADVSGLEKDGIVELLKKGGLVGMGGAGFPTSAKYATKDNITHLLVNAAECEPYLTCDEHLILEQGMAILNGIQVLKKAANADNAIICMEDNKAHCKEVLDKLLAGHEEEIKILLLPTKYPQGGEKQLIKAAMGIELPSGKLPSNVGAMVSNIHTCKAAADMVLGGIPCISRVITITGDVKEPGNYLVPLGTDIGELVGLAGDVATADNKVILGGPMTGRCIGTNMTAESISTESRVAVSKVSGGLIVLKGYHPEESACIKCGRCAQACPIGLAPAAIEKAYDKNNLDKCQKINATECIACACCSYVCPARRELTQKTVAARDAVRAKMREEAAKKNG